MFLDHVSRNTGILAKNYCPSVLERLALILGARRPMEERLDALHALPQDANTRRERRAISEKIRLFQYALREIHNTSPGQIFLLRSPHFTQKLEFVGWTNASIFTSFQTLLESNIVKMDINERGFMVEKWDITGETPEELFTFDLRSVDGKPAVTNLYVNPSQIKQVGVRQETLNRGNYGITGRHPYPLPFSTGELVKLNAPIFKRPIYGVLYSEDDLNGTRYIFLGYISFCRRGFRFKSSLN